MGLITRTVCDSAYTGYQVVTDSVYRDKVCQQTKQMVSEATKECFLVTCGVVAVASTAAAVALLAIALLLATPQTPSVVFAELLIADTTFELCGDKVCAKTKELGKHVYESGRVMGEKALDIGQEMGGKALEAGTELCHWAMGTEPTFHEDLDIDPEYIDITFHSEPIEVS